MYDKLMREYASIVAGLRKKDDFTDDEIDAYRLDCDMFSRTWLTLFGASKITNYVSMIRSGVLASLLRIHRNIYRLVIHSVTY
jgi:hypothetical protein